MKRLKKLLESQHCTFIAINKEKTSFAFLMPKSYDLQRRSATLPKPADQMTDDELLKAVADSVSGGKKR